MARRASKPAQASWGDPPRTRSATLMKHTASPPVKTSSVLELRCRQIVVKRMGRQSFNGEREEAIVADYTHALREHGSTLVCSLVCRVPGTRNNNPRGEL